MPEYLRLEEAQYAKPCQKNLDISSATCRFTLDLLKVPAISSD